MERTPKKNHPLSRAASPLKKIASDLKRGDHTIQMIPHHDLKLDMLAQPNDVTCGPTCLHAVYSFFQDDIPLDQLIEEVHAFEGGGTLAVWLGCHALKRNYEAIIYTYDLHLFDPTWFKLSNKELQKKLEKQQVIKQDPKLTLTTTAFKEFLSLGGKVHLEELTKDLLTTFLLKRIPILTGLSSTYLYRQKREVWATNQPDDLYGEPVGHFVVLSGYEKLTKKIYISDPYAPNPYKTHTYKVPLERVLNAILLGILTFDANFLIIYPKSTK